MVNGLRERGVDRVSAGAVLGGGATARSALAVLQQVADAATVYVRTPARAEQLLSVAAELGLACTVRPWEERHDGLAAPVVMVTTPVGATDDLAEVVPDEPGALLDVGYSSGETALATSLGSRRWSGRRWARRARAPGRVAGVSDDRQGRAGQVRDAGERAVAARSPVAG